VIWREVHFKERVIRLAIEQLWRLPGMFEPSHGRLRWAEVLGEGLFSWDNQGAVLRWPCSSFDFRAQGMLGGRRVGGELKDELFLWMSALLARRKD
jgi:hypothetical protein